MAVKSSCLSISILPNLIVPLVLHITMELFNLSREQFLLIYKISYYGGAVAVCAGLASIVIRTKCSFRELMALRYSPYYQSEISAFILFSAVVIVYLSSAFGIPYLEFSLNKIAIYSRVNGEVVTPFEKDVHLFMKYFVKTLLELVLVLFTISTHRTCKVCFSKFTRLILVISTCYGLWHLIRAIDVVVLKTNYLSDFYGPLNILMTAIVSLLMFFYALRLSHRTYRDF